MYATKITTTTTTATTAQAAKGIHHWDRLPDAAAPDQAPRDPLALRLPAALPPAPHLRAAQSEASALWSGVEGHLERFSDLPGLVDGVVGSELHPYAVDGGKLLALAGLAPAEGAAPAGGSGEVDVAAMLEGWVDRLEALEGRIGELDGTAGGAQGPPTPLLATADARSHAPHLFAQLGVHRACLQGMGELEMALEAELAATGGCWGGFGGGWWVG